MPARYTDFVSDKDARTDFVPRDRKPTLPVLLLMLMFGIAISVGLPILVLDKWILTMWLCVLMMFAGWLIITEIIRSRDLILATEFQNALFASALGFGNKFCMIVKQEGSIVYMDNGLQKMFPELVKERVVSVAGMLKHGKVDASDREKIFSALGRAVYDKIIFDIRGESNVPAKIVMSLEPILRPSGYILLRGREFIEQRTREGAFVEPAAPASGNPLLSKSSVTLFAYIMDRMNTGVYVTDPAGTIIYANRLIEHWLAYRDTEMTTVKLSLKDIVHQVGTGTETVTPGNFEGEASLRKKDGGLVKAFINQKVVLGEEQKALGCVAMINNMVELDPNLKKALW